MWTGWQAALVGFALILAGCVPAVQQDQVGCPDALCPSTGSGVTSPVHFAYVVNTGDNTISQFTVDEATGVVRPNGYVSSVVGSPSSILAHPSGRFMYVGTTTQFQLFSIDGTTGWVTPVGSSVTGASPTLDPTGQFLYALVSGTQVQAFSINQSTGALTAIGSGVATGATVSSRITVHPTQPLLYVTNSTDPRTTNGAGSVSYYGINTNGSVSLRVDPGTSKNFFDPGTSDGLAAMIMDPQGRYLAISGSLGRLGIWQIVPATGFLAFSYNMNNPGFNAVDELALDPGPSVVYVLSRSVGLINTHKVDLTLPTIPTFTSIGSQSVTTPQIMQFDPDLSNLWVTSTSGTTQNTLLALPISGTGAPGTPTNGIRARSSPQGFTKTAPQRSVSYGSKFAYLANSTGNTVSAYTINTGSGALTAVGPALAAGTAPYGVAVDPRGRFVYVVNRTSNDVSGYTINSATGALTSVGPTIAAGTSPQGIVVDPSGQFVYVANEGSNNVSGYTINATTGVLTSIGAPVAAGSLPWNLAVDPTGRFLYAVNDAGNNVSAFTIASSGALTAVGGSPFTAGSNPQSVAVDPTGRFAYTANTGGATVSAFSITSSTGALVSVGPAVSVTGQVVSVAVDPTGRFVYAAADGPPSSVIFAFSINQSTGALTQVGSSLSTGSTPYGLSVDTTGQYVYVGSTTSNNVMAYSIDQTTGGLTALPGLTTSNAGQPRSVSVLGGTQ